MAILRTKCSWVYYISNNHVFISTNVCPSIQPPINLSVLNPHSTHKGKEIIYLIFRITFPTGVIKIVYHNIRKSIEKMGQIVKCNYICSPKAWAGHWQTQLASPCTGSAVHTKTHMMKIFGCLLLLGGVLCRVLRLCMGWQTQLASTCTGSAVHTKTHMMKIFGCLLLLGGVLCRVLRLGGDVGSAHQSVPGENTKQYRLQISGTAPWSRLTSIG